MKTITFTDEQHAQLLEVLTHATALYLGMIGMIEKMPQDKNTELAITEAYQSVEDISHLKDVIDPNWRTPLADTDGNKPEYFCCQKPNH